MPVVNSLQQMSRNPSSSSSWGMLLFFVVTLVFMVAGYFFWESWNESQRQLALLEKRKMELEREVQTVRARVRNNDEYLKRVRNDSEFFMNEVRQRLGYVAPGEFVIQTGPQRNTSQNTGVLRTRPQ